MVLTLKLGEVSAVSSSGRIPDRLCALQSPGLSSSVPITNCKSKNTGDFNIFVPSLMVLRDLGSTSLDADLLLETIGFFGSIDIRVVGFFNLEFAVTPPKPPRLSESITKKISWQKLMK